MRGKSSNQSSMLCLVSPESRVPSIIRYATSRSSPTPPCASCRRLFDAMYAETGRPSVPPERLLKSLLLIALHSIRSERQFCQQLEFKLLFRWFVDMDMLEEAFDASTFSRTASG
jgi:hypothetical protein